MSHSNSDYARKSNVAVLSRWPVPNNTAPVAIEAAASVWPIGSRPSFTRAQRRQRDDGAGRQRGRHDDPYTNNRRCGEAFLGMGAPTCRLRASDLTTAMCRVRQHPGYTRAFRWSDLAHGHA